MLDTVAIKASNFFDYYNSDYIDNNNAYNNYYNIKREEYNAKKWAETTFSRKECSSYHIDNNIQENSYDNINDFGSDLYVKNVSNKTYTSSTTTMMLSTLTKFTTYGINSLWSIWSHTYIL